MSRIAIALSAILLLAGYAGAQQKNTVKTPSGKVYHTGRKPLPAATVKQLLAQARGRHGDLIARLPKVTAASFDCRQNGWVPPIRDQGQCGSCWDFSGSGVVTSALIKAGQIPNSSNGCSEQYTLDCGQNGGCGGDDNITVLQWAKATGLPLDKDYGVSYRASSGRCQYKSGMTMYKLSDWGFCDQSNTSGVPSVDSIKKAMVTYGPIGVGIDASGLGDGTGIISGTGHSIDHDVILVGWDDSKGNGGCWIMRNSWGTSWGAACGGTEAGYCYIQYGAWDVGTEACWALATPTKPPNPWVFSTQTSLVTPESPAACCGNQKYPVTSCACGGDPTKCVCDRGLCECVGGQDCSRVKPTYDTKTIYRDPVRNRRWRYTDQKGNAEWLPEPQAFVQPAPMPVMLGGGFARGASC